MKFGFVPISLSSILLLALGLPTAVATSGNFLPISSITTGATDPSVTQANINSTICVSGYTATVRPPSEYTTSLKISQLRDSYSRYSDLKKGDFEEDHLISLEIGGSPKSPLNLWPEPYAGSMGARIKDQLENKLHELVCSGRLALKTAQQAIASNWLTAYSEYVRNTGAPLSTSNTTTPTVSVTPLPPSTPLPPAKASAVPSPSNSPITSIDLHVVLDAPKFVTKGSDITLSAKVTPNDVCTLQVILPSGRDSTAAGIGTTKASGSGAVSWTWNVKSNTGSGIANVKVTCSVSGSASTEFGIG